MRQTTRKSLLKKAKKHRIYAENLRESAFEIETNDAPGKKEAFVLGLRNLADAEIDKAKMLESKAREANKVVEEARYSYEALTLQTQEAMAKMQGRFAIDRVKFMAYELDLNIGTMAEMLSDIEEKLSIKCPDNAKVGERMRAAEIKMFGELRY